MIIREPIIMHPISNPGVVINQYSYNPEIVKKEKENKEEESEANEYSFLQKILAGLIVAGAIPVASHYIVKDYNRYIIYERIEKRYREYRNTVSDPKLIQILDQWKRVRKHVWSQIASDVKTKASGGVGIVTTGVSLVLGSTLGFISGAIITGCAVANVIWKRSAENVKKRDIDALNKNVDLFICTHDMDIDY